MSHSLPPLAYAYDALEPHVDAATMEIHHARHHQAYVNGLNAALEGTEWSDVPVEWLLTRLHDLPPALHTAVRNHGGGHANHTLFWSVMSSQGGGEPTPFIATAIARDLGGWAAFKDSFTKAALTRFGSGWAWLSVVAGGGLVVESTANQDSPLMEGRTPILGLDVWEHAYYLKHQNRRPEYIAAFFNVVDWNEVERRYSAAMA